MAKEKQPVAPEPAAGDCCPEQVVVLQAELVQPVPQLSPQTQAEMEFGRRQAAINAQALVNAQKARAEEASDK